MQARCDEAVSPGSLVCNLDCSGADRWMNAFTNLKWRRGQVFTHSFGMGRDKGRMRGRLAAVYGSVPIVLGVITMAGVVALLAWDLRPELFSVRAHDFLGAFPLALIAVAYLIYQLIRRPPAAEMAKAVLLAAAFLLWAANQYWPNARGATLCNDLAIALFVLDVFLVMAGWPSAEQNEGFADEGESS